MAWIAGVFDNCLGLPLTPPGIEVLDGRELGPSDVLGCTHHPLYLLAVGCLASSGVDTHTHTVVKRARQHLFPLKRLKRFGIGPQILKVLQLHH